MRVRGRAGRGGGTGSGWWHEGGSDRFPGAMADFAAEGLLDGLQGDARAARERLLADLHEEGVPLEELRTAVADDTLFLLPAERRVGGIERYSLNEIARD